MKIENDSQDNAKPFTGNVSTNNWSEIQKKFQQHYHIYARFYALKELAEIYKVCPSTLKRMIAPYTEIVGKRKGRYYSIIQVKLIFQYVDLPSSYTIKELAHLYNVSVPTFKGWLDKFHDELGEKPGYHYSFRQLYIILSKLDIPGVEGKEYEHLISFLQLCNQGKI